MKLPEYKMNKIFNKRMIDVLAVHTPVISVIVPVYNGEKYLCECIDSITNQTFTDFELLLIDDGSRDNSLQICKKYAFTDSRIIIISQDNQGVSSARNHGIQKSKGEYLIFVDSDDKIEIDALEVLYDSIKKYNCDIVVSKIYRFNEKGVMRRYGDFVSQLVDKESLRAILFHVLLTKDRVVFPKDLSWAGFTTCIYKSGIIRNNRIEFRDFRIGEDSLFLYDYLLSCNSGYLLSKEYYGYRMSPHSATHKFIPNYLEDTLIRYNYWKECLEKHHLLEDVNVMYHFNKGHSSRVYYAIMMLFYNPILESPDFNFRCFKMEYIKCIENIKPYWSYLNRKEKMKILITGILVKNRIMFCSTFYVINAMHRL